MATIEPFDPEARGKSWPNGTAVATGKFAMVEELPMDRSSRRMIRQDHP